MDQNLNLTETEMNRNLGYIILQPKPKFLSKSCGNQNLIFLVCFDKNQQFKPEDKNIFLKENC